MAECIQDADDDVPPLDDMTELLEQVKDLHRSTQEKLIVPTKPSSPEKSSQMANGGKKKEVDVSPKKTEQAKPSQKSDTFMGMKKGFLLGGLGEEDKPKARKPAEDGIPVIAPKEQDAQALRLQEVQDQMERLSPFLHGEDWLTSDFLEKLQSRPHLLKLLEQPQFIDLLMKLEKNPAAARDQLEWDPQLCSVFKDFCGLLGDHFTSLAERSSPTDQPSPCQPGHTEGSAVVKARDEPGADMSVRSSTDPRQPTAEDEAKIREILSDPEVQKAFTDVRIKELVMMVKEDPLQAQKTMHTASPEMKRKIQKLIHVGLLGLEV